MEQRRQYRISASDLQGLSVSVSRGQTTGEGVLVDVSAAGAGVWLEDAGTLGLSIEDHVRLRIGARELPDPFEVGATTRFRSEDAGGVRYGFQFDSPEELDRQLPPSLQALFNRRFMLRAQPDAEHPVRLTIWTLLGVFEHPHVRVRDVSGIGLSFLADLYVARRLEGLSRIRLGLHLPHREEPLALYGRIRYLLSLGSQTRIGLEFDARATERFIEKQRAIVQYVVGVKREGSPRS